MNSDQFVRFDGARPDVDRDQPDLPLKLVLQRDQAILYRDFGGAPLHKRGYREVQHKSPLNEALAAGLVLLSDWDGEAPLVDPMCGSATFLIEAAFLAMDRAPGLGRAFAFERWKDTDQEAWQKVYDEAEERAARRQDLCPPLAGNDQHPGAIAISNSLGHFEYTSVAKAEKEPKIGGEEVGMASHEHRDPDWTRNMWWEDRSGGDRSAWQRNTGHGWAQNRVLPISPDYISGQQAFNSTVVRIRKLG